MNCRFMNVSKSFDKTSIFNNVSFQLHAGIPYALCGASGSGKTTLLRLICGLEKPDSGKIEFSSKPCFSYAFQEPRLIEQISVRRNIELVEPNRSVDDLIGLLNLADAAYKYPFELSGGMKKRASLARALAAEADIYLIDEPTAGQDSEHASMVLSAIRKFTANALCVVASHDELFIKEYAAKRVLAANGSITVSDVIHE